jgi:F-type H+-transporting ATPase subunit delta
VKITKQARRDAKQLFRSCVVNGLLDENCARRTVAEVVARKPRGYVGILSHFHRLVKLDVEQRTAVVESPVPISSELQASVTQELSRLYGQGLSISFTQNPELIGGLRIKVGSDVFDGSVRARLNQLEANF